MAAAFLTNRLWSSQATANFFVIIALYGYIAEYSIYAGMIDKHLQAEIRMRYMIKIKLRTSEFNSPSKIIFLAKIGRIDEICSSVSFGESSIKLNNKSKAVRVSSESAESID